MGYKVFSFNPEVWDKLKERYLQFYREIESICDSEPTGADRISLLLVQMLDLEEISNVIRKNVD